MLMKLNKAQMQHAVFGYIMHYGIEHVVEYSESLSEFRVTKDKTYYFIESDDVKDDFFLICLKNAAFDNNLYEIHPFKSPVEGLDDKDICDMLGANSIAYSYQDVLDLVDWDHELEDMDNEELLSHVDNLKTVINYIGSDDILEEIGTVSMLDYLEETDELNLDRFDSDELRKELVNRGEED